MWLDYFVWFAVSIGLAFLVVVWAFFVVGLIGAFFRK